MRIVCTTPLELKEWFIDSKDETDVSELLLLTGWLQELAKHTLFSSQYRVIARACRTLISEKLV